jgi:uncharacterized protein YerC
MILYSIHGHGIVSELEELVQNVLLLNNGVEMEYLMDEKCVMMEIQTMMMHVKIIVSHH